MSANYPGTSSTSSTSGNDNGADGSSRTTTAAGTSSLSGRTSGYDDTRAAGRNGARVTAETMRNDLTAMRTEIDSLITRAQGMGETELSEAYARMVARFGKFGSMKYAAKGIAAQATRQLNEGVDRTSDYVRNKPLQSVAIAAGSGLVLGMLLARR